MKKDLYKTTYGATVMAIRNKYAFPKWAASEYGSKWLNNKQLIKTYSLEQMLLCLKTK